MTKAARRSGGYSSWTVLAVACIGAALMALAFPKTGATVLAPLGAVGVFWAWFGLSPKRAFLIGWAAGSVFFAINYSWFGETAGALIAPFGFLMTLGPGIGDALFAFALVGLLIAYLAKRARAGWLPLAGAAAFAWAEWLRCEGLGQLGVPFGSLGYSQVGTVFAPLGADIGTYGVTFVVMLLAAYAAYAVRSQFSRTSLRAAGIAYACVAVATALSWLTWPARSAPPPTLPARRSDRSSTRPARPRRAGSRAARQRRLPAFDRERQHCQFAPGAYCRPATRDRVRR